MKRREFLHRAAYAAGAVWLDPKTAAKQTFPLPAQAGKFSGSDTVRLGSTGIQTSRLAMGTGTVGSGHHSHQTALGIKGLADLLLNGYDHGLRFFDTADSYGSHPHVAEALKRVPRDKVNVLTKTWARDAATARADLERFRRELGTDYIDICLMHCLTEADWTDRFQPVMDVLSEAKQKGVIRAHGFRQIALGGRPSCAHQSAGGLYGRSAGYRRERDARNALERSCHRGDEDSWPRGIAKSTGRSVAVRAVAGPPGRLHHRGRI